MPGIPDRSPKRIIILNNNGGKFSFKLKELEKKIIKNKIQRAKINKRWIK